MVRFLTTFVEGEFRLTSCLYTDRPIDSGLLYYTQSNTLIRVQPVRNELRGLIIGRNEMARYLAPPTQITTKHVKKEDEEAGNTSMPPSQPPKFFSSPIKQEQESRFQSFAKFEPKGEDMGICAHYRSVESI
jgi:hypothetical protein